MRFILIVVSAIILSTQGTALADTTSDSKAVKELHFTAMAAKKNGQSKLSLGALRFESSPGGYMAAKSGCPAGGLVIVANYGTEKKVKYYCDAEPGKDKVVVSALSKPAPSGPLHVYFGARFTNNDACPAGGVLVYDTLNGKVEASELNCDDTE